MFVLYTVEAEKNARITCLFYIEAEKLLGLLVKSLDLNMIKYKKVLKQLQFFQD